MVISSKDFRALYKLLGGWARWGRDSQVSLSEMGMGAKWLVAPSASMENKYGRRNLWPHHG